MLNLVALTFINCLVIAIVVLIHHESLIILSRILKWKFSAPQTKVLVGVFGALGAHSVEVWVFGLAYYLLNLTESFGNITGNFDGSFVDCVYLSFTCFTTLGFGDVIAEGSIRFLTVIESLTGLVLIAWSTSFLFLQMQQYWHDKRN